MATFAELITEYTLRIGIADAELARKIGVRRQTIFRWKEGLVKRPRDRDVILQIAKALRLTPEERDGLLLAAGFAPEVIPETPKGEDFPPEVVGDEETYSDDSETVLEVTDKPAVDTKHIEHTADTETTETTADARDIADIEAITESIADSVHSSDAQTIPPSNSKPSNSKQAQQNRIESRVGGMWIAGIATVMLIGLVSWLLWPEETVPPEAVINNALEPSISTIGDSESPPTGESTSSALVFSNNSAQTEVPAPCSNVTDDEIFALVARFVPYGTKRFNVAGRILEALSEEAQSEDLAALRVHRLDVEFSSKAQVAEFMENCPAAVLIWGEYDDGRVVAQTTSIRDARIQFPADLETVFDVDVPAEVRILALEALGLVLRSENRYAEAAAAFERALSHPDNASLNLPTDSQRFNLNLYLGAALYSDAVQQGSRGGFQAAIESYDAALALAPSLDRSGQALHYNRGIAYLDLHRSSPDDDPQKAYLDLAINDLNEALRIKGTQWDEVPAYTMRGIAQMTRKSDGDLDAALRDFSAAITLNPKPDYYFNRALGHIAADHVDLWEEDLASALELGYPARSIYTARCYAYLRQFQPEEARAACELAIAQEPQSADTAYVNYAIALAVLGDQEQSIRYLTEHIEWLNSNLGYYERLQGKQADAWLAQLQAGEQPFTEEVLRRLE